MIIVKLVGGLGNQMFQYAMARRLSEVYGATLKMDLFALLDRAPRKDFVFRNYGLDIFNVNEKFATKDEIESLMTKDEPKIFRLLRKAVGRPESKNIIREPYFHFCSDLLTLPDNVYLDGYWQSEKYFIDIENTIRTEFSFRINLPLNCYNLVEKISTHDSVCLNVRRADFVTIPLTNKYHGFLGLDYIEKAVTRIADVLKTPHFFVFSDDIEWCRNNIRLPFPVFFVTHDYAGEHFKDYLQLMIMCKHFIIPNSTFGWWAAWLCKNPNKIVVAPERWFNDPNINANDLIPKTWIRM